MEAISAYTKRRSLAVARDQAVVKPLGNAMRNAIAGSEDMHATANRKDVELLVEIARMYYEYGLGQQEIAERVGLSRSRISRMLTRAREAGIVQVTIVDPFREESLLAQELQARYGLKRAIVCPVPRSSRAPLAWHLAQAAARLLREIVRDGAIIGVCGGTTMLEVARALRPLKRKNVSVVQLEGTLSGKGEALIHGNEIALLFSRAFAATPFFLSVPAIVEHEQVKEALLSDRNVAKVLDMGKAANIAAFSIGRPDRSSLLVQAGYFSPEEMDSLVAAGAVGDLCSRFFAEDGSICDESLNRRTIGLELQDFMHKDFSVAVAGGPQKVAGIRGALRGRFANVLVTDEATARQLLDLECSLDQGQARAPAGDEAGARVEARGQTQTQVIDPPGAGRAGAIHSQTGRIAGDAPAGRAR